MSKPLSKIIDSKAGYPIGVHLTFPSGKKGIVRLYEPEGHAWIPALNCFICYGHEEIKIVGESGTIFKTHTR